MASIFDTFLNTQFFRKTEDESQSTLQKLINVIAKLPAALPFEISAAGDVQPHEPDYWQPFNILGQGGQGLATLWRHDDPGNDYDGMFVVLKTGLDPEAERRLSQEAKVMLRLSKDNQEHFVAMVYCGTDLNKIYLEFCKGGDLNVLLKKQVAEKKRLDEEDIWRMFLCLIEGLNTMHHANPEGATIHFDLKGENAFIDTDPVIHRCTPDTRDESTTIYKIADFGLAQYSKHAGAGGVGTLAHANAIGGRGTQLYYAPEMFTWLNAEMGPPAVDFLGGYAHWEMVYGLSGKTDVWAIAMIMWMFMELDLYPPSNKYANRMTGRDGRIYEPENQYHEGGMTCGGFDHKYYSQELQQIVLWSLMYLPQQRPDAKQLLPLLKEKVADFEKKRVESAAREVRVEEARARVAARALEAARGLEPRMSALGITHPYTSPTPAVQPEPVKDHYTEATEDRLISQGRTKESFDKARAALSAEEEERLMHAFYFAQEHTEEFNYFTREDKDHPDTWKAGEKEWEIALLYQMVLEESFTDQMRALSAYMRRIDVTYSGASRNTLIRRQRVFERSDKYLPHLVDEFNKRHGATEVFGKSAEIQEKIKGQRAWEDLQPQPQLKPETSFGLDASYAKIDRRIMRHRFLKRTSAARGLSGFARRMEAEGRVGSQIKSEMVHLQLQWDIAEAAAAEVARAAALAARMADLRSAP